MNKTVHTLDFEKILRILKETEDKYVFEKVNLIPKEDDLLDKLQRYVNYGQVNRKAVLGIDIYKYSSYEEFAQTLVPCMFKLLFRETIDMCFKNHAFLFQKYTKAEFEENFISTGDGGYVMFDNPLHALLLPAILQLCCVRTTRSTCIRNCGKSWVAQASVTQSHTISCIISTKVTTDGLSSTMPVF